MNESTKRNIKMGVLFAVVFCAAFFVTSHLMKGCKGNAKLEAAAEQINQNTPSMIDAETRLDSATVLGNTLRYHFSLPHESLARKSFDPESAKAFLIDQAQKNYDSQPQMENLRADNVVLHYFYTDGEGQRAFDFTIKPKQK